MSGVEVYESPDRSKHSYKVKEMRTSVHAYMLVAYNRFIDQSHMYILENFVMEYKDALCRMLDQQYAPNSGTESGYDISNRMVER